MAEREPPEQLGRLDTVTPGLLPLDDHAQHDRWLIVRATTHDDDLSDAETATAKALLGGCSDCATLASDITTIAYATAASVVPARPRDFRLTPAQAERAGGGFLDRLGRWLSTPRGTVVRPLAAASLAIGIVLVAVGPSIQGPLQPPASTPNAEIAAPGATATGEPMLTMQMDTAPSPNGGAGVQGDAQLAPAGSTEPATTLASGGPDPRLMPPAAKATSEPRFADVQGVAGTTPEPGNGGQEAVATSAPRTTDDTAWALTLVGIVLAGTGLLVLSLTWLARRMSRSTAAWLTWLARRMSRVPLLPG